MTDCLIPDAHSLLTDIARHTPARLLVGSAGPAYRTATWLALRADHAAATDAVYDEMDLARDFKPEFVASRGLFTVQTLAADKREHLLRPDLGRRFGDDARAAIAARCQRRATLQFVMGDGLSAAAVRGQVPTLLPLLEEEALRRRLVFGQTFAVRYCRVGLLNEVGELLEPEVVVLLIGERPGLATADSLSAYLAYRPQLGHIDAQRNLISNIHARGVNCEAAAVRILDLVEQLRERRSSGMAIKEQSPAHHLPGLPSATLP